MPQPIAPASSAVTHPRRMPSSRSETTWSTTASDDRDDDAQDARPTEAATHAQAITSHPDTAGAERRTATRPVRSPTSSTSVATGWNASALSASNIKRRAASAVERELGR